MCNPVVPSEKRFRRKNFGWEIEKELSERGMEPWQIICFRLTRGETLIAEDAIETEALMLDSAKSRW
jgi:hypothetical protein